MAAVRLSQLQKRIMSWLRADAQRTHGRMASSHQDLARALQHDKGNLSHSLRTLERHGFLTIQRSSGGQAESLLLTQAGQNKAAQLASGCE
jgi:DNA-binding MarR family transcriptional regulator